jgi:hypothetical protein
MDIRLPLAFFLLALGTLGLANGLPNMPVVYAGLTVGLALAITVALDAIWRERQP